MVRAAQILWLGAALMGCDQVFSLDRPEAPDAAPDAALPVESWLQVEGGSRHSCGIRRDHTLWCWGRNDAGQLGIGAAQADRERTEPAQVGTESTWDVVSVGTDTSCAIKSDHSLWCWGFNPEGQIGDGTTLQRAVPVQVPGAFVAVSNGPEHTCAIDEAMALHCWGDSRDGRLGTGSADTLVPAPVTGGGTWRLVRAGERSTCGIQTDGSLWCWGSNASGRLGVGGPVAMEVAPRRVGTELWKALSLDTATACAIRDVGLLRCWGANVRGQIGDSSNTSRGMPAPVGADMIMDWTAVATGPEHTCGIHGAGELACWGLNTHGQGVTDLTRESRSTPGPVLGGNAPWVSLGLGRRHSCAIDNLGQLWCAGYAANGALGTGEGSVREPTPVGAFSFIAAGEDATCALDAGSQLVCWGSNRFGLLGDGLVRDRMAPGPPMPRVYTSMDLGDHGCAIAAGERWCWGANDRGQLGDGTSNHSSTPMTVASTPYVWQKVSASRGHTCAVSTSNVLQCWGRNAERQTGSATTADMLTPYTHVGILWKDVGTGIDFTCGIRADGRAMCWGHPGTGQLGHNGATGVTNVPQLVASTLAFDSIVSGARHSCALIGTDAWCWGWNDEGQLGDASAITRGAPVRLFGAWMTLALGERHSCGIRTDGTLACWGDNQYGQLGDGTFVNKLEAVQIGTDSDWSSVTAGLRHTCAKKLDRTVLCWGANEDGAIGNDAAWRPTLELVTR